MLIADWRMAFVYTLSNSQGLGRMHIHSLILEKYIPWSVMCPTSIRAQTNCVSQLTMRPTYTRAQTNGRQHNVWVCGK